MPVSLNPATTTQNTLLKAVLWATSQISQDKKTGPIEAMQYANGQQSEMESDSNK